MAGSRRATHAPRRVELPDGRTVWGRGLRRSDPPDPLPTFGVYLLGTAPDDIAWEHRWVRWPDFRTPSSDADAIAALREAHERSRDEVVEIACFGGIGRTGSGIALLARMAGVAPDEAVAWARANYHPGAVEMPWQRRWVRRVSIGSDSTAS